MRSDKMGEPAQPLPSVVQALTTTTPGGVSSWLLDPTKNGRKLPGSKRAPNASPRQSGLRGGRTASRFGKYCRSRPLVFSLPTPPALPQLRFRHPHNLEHLALQYRLMLRAPPNLDGKTLESRRKKLRRDFLLHLPLLINHSVSPAQARGDRRLFLLPWIFGCRWQCTVACWPSTRVVRRTISPFGNSSAS